MGRSDHYGITPPGSGDVPSDIVALVADVETREAGFFGPDSVMWQVSRERVLLLSGVSTILLQLAHPKVAAGVADYSHFDEAPLSRFRRTFDLVHAIIFGDIDTAVEAALTIRATHARVTGTVTEDVGPFVAAEHYAASDPDLLLWVHATLLEQALTAYETYVATLSESETEDYYQESKVFGQLLGIPEETYPDTRAEFDDYYERMLATELAVGSQGSELQRTLFDQGHMLRPLYTFAGASTLPDAVRAEFELPWPLWSQQVLDAGAALVRALLPSLPARLRYVTEYRQARARLQRQGRAPHSASPSSANND